MANANGRAHGKGALGIGHIRSNWRHPMQNPESFLRSIESTVGEGRAVVTADNSTVVATMQETIRIGRTATFYAAPAPVQAVMRWFWTPTRVKAAGLERVSEEERSRIETDLGVEDMGPWFSNHIECSCGGHFGAYEFIEQGLKQHGKNWVGAILALKDTAVLRINPAQDTFCSQCGLILILGHNYAMYDRRGTMIYGCCSGPDTILV
jgi:hypothetical protein